MLGSNVPRAALNAPIVEGVAEVSVHTPPVSSPSIKSNRLIRVVLSSQIIKVGLAVPVLGAFTIITSKLDDPPGHSTVPVIV